MLVDKPTGVTSFDVIRQLRRHLGIKKMGHAGTLDPLASGLMIIGVGDGTKKLSDYLKLDKEYIAEILVGQKTETGDMEGEVIEEKAVEAEEAETFSVEKVSAALASLLGVQELPVSPYSAIKKDGVPFYKQARILKREGKIMPESKLPIREMKIFEAELLEITRLQKDSTYLPKTLNGLAILNDSKKLFILLRVRFKVGSGTYIRSLAEELGKRLGYPATLASLRRTKIGHFKIEDAEPLR